MAIFDFGTSGLDLTGFGDALQNVVSPLTVTPHPSGGFVSNLDDIVNQTANSVANIFNAQAKIVNAQTNAKVAQAMAKPSVHSAQSGLPSTNLLLLAGAGLFGVFLLTRSQK